MYKLEFYDPQTQEWREADDANVNRFETLEEAHKVARELYGIGEGWETAKCPVALGYAPSLVHGLTPRRNAR